MYLFETHIHTSKCSKCAGSTSIEMVDAALQKGYSGFVLTNHFFHGNTCIDRNLDWVSFVSAYKNDYIEAKEYGKKKNFTVLFGLEEGYGNGKEVLIYGIEPELIINHPEFKDMDIFGISAFIHFHGGILSAAHPFRNREYITNPDEPPVFGVFDAIEGYNYNNTPEDNEKAFRYAAENNLPSVSGGDVHQVTNFGFAGIAFENMVTNNSDFVKAIKLQNLKTIINSQIQC